MYSALMLESQWFIEVLEPGVRSGVKVGKVQPIGVEYIGLGCLHPLLTDHVVRATE